MGDFGPVFEYSRQSYSTGGSPVPDGTDVTFHWTVKGEEAMQLGEQGLADLHRLWNIFGHCASIFVARNRQRGNNFKHFGWRDSLHHMRSKLSRILQMFTTEGRERDLDDAYDEINYTAFFIMNVEDGNENGTVEI